MKIKKILTIEFFVDIILLIFALSSIATVSDYLIALNMNQVTSYAFGSGIGFVLVALSILLSRTDTKDIAFRSIALTTLCIALFSGYLQFSAYKLITGELWPSLIKGFSVPLFCEAALAYSVSVYSSYRKRKEIEEADTKFDEQLAIMQREASLNLDPEKIRAEVEGKMQQIVSARINKFTNDQLRKYDEPLPNEHPVFVHLREQLENVQKMNVHLMEQLESVHVHLRDVQNENVHLSEQIKSVHVHFERTMNNEHEIVHPKSVHNNEQMYTEHSGNVHVQLPTGESTRTIFENEHAMNGQNGNESVQKDVQKDGVNVQKNVHSKNEHVQKMTKEQKMYILIKHLIEHYNGMNTDELKPTKLAEELSIDRVTISRYLNELKNMNKINGHIDSALLLA